MDPKKYTAISWVTSFETLLTIDFNLPLYSQRLHKWIRLDEKGVEGIKNSLPVCPFVKATA